jgi:AhpD family alkylhydroperoxidase
MPRLYALEKEEMTNSQALLVEISEYLGAPDSLCAQIFVRSEVGRVWLRAWTEIVNGGTVPVTTKEMIRVTLSIAHFCGYCSTVRSKVAIRHGLSEEKLMACLDFENSKLHSEKEKAALRFAMKFRESDESLDSDEVFDDIKKYYTEEEIVEIALLCGNTIGVGRFARALQMRTWGEACMIQPRLNEFNKEHVPAE